MSCTLAYALCALIATAGPSVPATIVSVYDGDTITVRIASVVDPVKVRLIDIDAPEMRGRVRRRA